MLWKSELLFFSLAGLASAACSHDDCYTDITRRQAGIADCEAYLEVTDIAPTPTLTVTYTASPTTVLHTVTDTLYVSATRTDIVPIVVTETTIIKTTPYAEAIVTATATVDITDYEYQLTTLTTITRLSGGNKIERAASTTTTPRTIPAYASDCHSAAAYVDACFCAGATVGSTTYTPPPAATTLTTTVTPTVTNTSHVTKTDTATAATVTTTMTSTETIGRVSFVSTITFTTFTETKTTVTRDVSTVEAGTLTETVTVTP